MLKAVILLKIKVLYYSTKYNNVDFKASSGWLQSFQKRHNISSKYLSGESGLVDLSNINDFYELINQKLSEYAPEDVFNTDESSLFYKCTPNRSLMVTGEDKKTGKFCKERVTMLIT